MVCTAHCRRVEARSRQGKNRGQGSPGTPLTSAAAVCLLVSEYFRAAHSILFVPLIDTVGHWPLQNNLGMNAVLSGLDQVASSYQVKTETEAGLRESVCYTGDLHPVRKIKTQLIG